MHNNEQERKRRGKNDDESGGVADACGAVVLRGTAAVGRLLAGALRAWSLVAVFDRMGRGRHGLSALGQSVKAHPSAAKAVGGDFRCAPALHE